MSSVIKVDPEILGGTPVFMGTRVPVESHFDYLTHGHTVEYFLEQFPTVERDQAQALPEEAKQRVIESVGVALTGANGRLCQPLH